MFQNALEAVKSRLNPAKNYFSNTADKLEKIYVYIMQNKERKKLGGFHGHTWRSNMWKTVFLKMIPRTDGRKTIFKHI